MGFYEKEWPVPIPHPVSGRLPNPCSRAHPRPLHCPLRAQAPGLTPVDHEATSLTPAKATANVWAPQRDAAPVGPQLIRPLRDTSPSGVTDEKQQSGSPSLGDSSYHVKGHGDTFLLRLPESCQWREQPQEVPGPCCSWPISLRS